MPDLHAPYHCPEAFGCFLAVCRGWRPDTCVSLGDLADFAEVSAHAKNPKRRIPFKQEAEGVNAALDQLDAALKAGGCTDKRWLEGNHETRLARYVASHSPELDGIVDWRDLLNADKRRWIVTPYKESLQLGHLRLTHDVGRAGVNAARQTLADVGESVAFGHTHRIQVTYQGTVGGRKLVGATLGWLGDPEAIDYRHKDQVRRDSIHGFGAVYMKHDGTFWLNAVPIINGECVLDGVLYRAK
jgi:hypothetical protein